MNERIGRDKQAACGYAGMLPNKMDYYFLEYEIHNKSRLTPARPRHATPAHPKVCEALPTRFALDNLHSSFPSNLLNSGSIFSCFFLLLSLVASATLKNVGAASVKNFGSIAMTSRMYSLVVMTSSWYTTH